ncbi:MAG: L-malate glycosyltransferase, partial [Solirubrobacteraceae bacterium]|nr:L-malate glycosyltransferase [Solirubrobacteraceae bacterium]
PNGASESEFAQRDERLVAAFREEHRIRGPMLLTVGSHSGTKGHRQCLAAFALADTGPATLVINGDGRRHSGCTDACRRLSRALGPLLAARGKRVVMTDLDRAALVTAFHAADLFVLLSRIECSPVVLYEALAARTPFISSDTGNAREIARQTGGGEIVRTLGQPQSRPVADPLAAVRAIERLLGDGARRADMAEAGHAAWRRRFTWERLTDDYLAVYDEVMTRRAPLPLGTGS